MPTTWLQRRPMAFAHRGGHDGGHPEHSLAALADAVARGAMVETDVRLSLGGTPVLVHDAIRFRRGIPIVPALTPARWLARLGVGTLADLFASLPSGVHVSIDLKVIRAWHAVVDEARAAGVSDRVWLVHDSLLVLGAIRAADADIRLVHEARPRVLAARNETLEDHPVRLAEHGIDAQNTTAGQWTADAVANAHRHGVFAFGSMVQSAEMQRAALEIGLDALYSDYVDRLVTAADAARHAVSGVVFDFGSTLFGHRPGDEVVDEHARRVGVDLGTDGARRIWQRIDAAAMDPAETALGRDLDPGVWDRRWRHLYALADDDVPGLGDALHRSFHDPADWIPYADTVAVLEGLAEREVPVVVLSNTGWDVASVLRHHRIDHLVRAVVTSYEVGATKPDARAFLAACERLGVDPASVLMVGDDHRADRAALLAGLGGVLLVDPTTPVGGTQGLTEVLTIVDDDRRTSSPGQV